MKQLVRKLLCGALAAMMLVTSFAGCSGGNNSSTSSTGGDSSTSDTSSEATTSDTGTADGEYPVIRINYSIIQGSDGEADVEAALNEIMREEAGAEVDLIGIEFANWVTQMNLMLAGGSDALDMYTSFWYAPMSTLYANGQVIALDELMETEAPDLKAYYDQYPEILDCGRINGELYGIPTIMAWSQPNIYVVQKADSEAAGIDWSQVNTLEDATEAMLAMKKANPDHYYIPGSTETYWVPKDIDYLGDTQYLGVLTNPTESTTIENYYESDYFMNFLDNVKIWAENDLISPDPMSNSNPSLVNLQYGISAGTPGYSWSIDEFLYENNATGQYGELVGAQIGDRLLTSGDATTYLWHISPFCEDQAAAMRVMNVLFTNAEASNLITNGVEGEHWVRDENGFMTYPEGKDISTVGWGGAIAPLGRLEGYVWDYEPANINEMMDETNEEAQASLALGFSFDSSEVADQVTACTNVVSQYLLPLMYGEVDIDATLPEFQQQLKNAGIDDIIAAKQEQLDAWLAAKGE